VSQPEIEVRIRGVDELAAGTRQLAGNIDEAARGEFLNVADQVAGQVSGSVPRRSGRLAGSVHATAAGEGASVSMGEGVRYAEFVEYGGRGHPHSATGNYLYPTAMAAEPLLVAAGVKVAVQEIGAMQWPTPT
jgi:Bacteriophage HK97-gp10, putative tail-component